MQESITFTAICFNTSDALSNSFRSEPGMCCSKLVTVKLEQIVSFTLGRFYCYEQQIVFRVGNYCEFLDFDLFPSIF